MRRVDTDQWLSLRDTIRTEAGKIMEEINRMVADYVIEEDKLAAAEVPEGDGK
jgi:hypothetical protein